MRQASVEIMRVASNASANGSAFDARQAVSASFQVRGTELDEAGTLKIQGSNDVVTAGAEPGVPTNWSDITNASATVASGLAPMIVIPAMSFAYIRAVYTRSGGGTADARLIVRMNYIGV